MRIVVVGSTGVIGSRIADEAELRGHTVLRVSRSGSDGGATVDALDVPRLTDVLRGHDVVVMAVRLPTDGLALGELPEACLTLLEAVRASAVGRLMVVGGGATLESSRGHRLLDDPGFPERFVAQANAQAAWLGFLRSSVVDVDWTYVSPNGGISPGTRRGHYRVAGDELLVDAEGSSWISCEDYAVGFVDEMENHRNSRRRINLGY